MAVGSAPGRRQERCPGTLVDQQREELRCLAQSHVVGQARPETELAQKGEPSESAFLIRAELAGESIGRRGGLERAVFGTREQVAEPTVCRDVHDRQLARALLESQGGAQDLSGRHDVAGGAPLPDRGDGGGELVVMQLDPLAADTHERLLQPSQLAELGQPDACRPPAPPPSGCHRGRRDRW